MLIKKRWAALVFVLSVPLVAQTLPSGGSPQALNNREQQFQTAVSEFKAGRYDLAAQKLESMARQMPPNFEVEELLGLVYSAERKDLKANHDLEEAVRLKPDSVGARVNLAINLARLGKDREAETELRRVVRAEPDNFEINHMLGELCAHEGKIAEAITYLAKAQSLRPASYDNGYDLSLAYEKAGQLKKARQQILQLLQVKKTAGLYSLMAEVNEKSGNYLAAAKEYGEAAHMDPSEQNIFNWGSEFLLHNTWNPAIEIFTKGLQRYPDSAPLAIGLGLTLYWQGKYASAVKALVRATDLAPSDHNSYYFLGEAYDHVPEDVSPTETNKVIAKFHEFEEHRPRDPRAAYYYAVSLWEGKKTEGDSPNPARVESLLKKAIRLDPSFAKAYFELGNVYSQSRQYTEALQEYQQALRLNPNDANACYRLGQVYFHLGKKSLARKEFALHQKLLSHHQSEDTRQRKQTFQFVYSMRKHQASHSP